MRCLDDETVLGLVEGRLPPPRLTAADEHLDACATCRDVVAQLARASAPVLAPVRGAALGRYVVGDLLGAGAMGRVYSAWEPELDRRVAIKVLQDAAPGARERLVREAQAMARLDHPNVVGVHEVGTTEGGVFVAMDLVEGATLRAWAEGGRRPWREVARVLAGTARGLAAIHAAGVIHRDVKPDNVIVGADGRARIGDFGLARAAGGTAAGAGPVRNPDTAPIAQGTPQPATSVAGTPAYMAPEVLRGGAATEASDQFGFGVTAYEILSGERPFTGHSWTELLRAIEERAPAPLRGVPGWLDAAIRRCLAADPRRRFSSMSAAADLLAEQSQRRRAAVWLTGAAAAAVLASGATWLAVRGQPAAGPSCDTGAAQISAVWNPASRGRLAPLGAPALAALDSWAAAWASERDATCAAAPLDPAPRIAAREHCLDRRRAELGALIDRIAQPPANTSPASTSPANTSPASASPGGASPGGASPSGASLSGASPSGAPPGGATPGGAPPSGVSPASASSGGATSGGATSGGATSGGASPSGASPAHTAPLGDRLLDALAALSPAECREVAPGAPDPLPLDPDRAAAVRAVQAELAGVRVAVSLGDVRPVFGQAAQLVERARASGHAPTLAEALLAHADALRGTARLPEAADAAREALVAAERGRDDLTAARAWIARVAIAGDRRELALADDFGAVAAGALDRAGAPARLAGQLLRLRGLAAFNRGRLDEAAALLGEARARFAAAGGERSVDVAGAESALGIVARERGDLDAAERHHRAALETSRALRGPRHPDVARDLHNLAGVLRRRGDLDTAAATYRAALSLLVEARGERSAEAGLTHNSLALVHMERRDWAAARAELERARAALGAAGHGDAVFAEHNLGLVAAATGDPRAALVHYTAAAALYAQTIGADARPALQLLVDRARVEAALGDRAAARTHAALARDRARAAGIAYLVEEADALLSPAPAVAPQVAKAVPAVQPALQIDPPPPPTARSPETAAAAPVLPTPPAAPPPAAPLPARPLVRRDVGTYGASQDWSTEPSPPPPPAGARP